MLVERDSELQRVREALAAAARGAGMAVLVEGPAGIGKTSILADGRALAAELGMQVLHARGTQLESGYAMGLVRQALEPAVRDSHAEDSLFAGAAELARGVLLDVAAAPQVPPVGVLHGLYWLVVNIAQRAPVLLAVDDVHWADEPSLRFLAYLTRRVESSQISLLLAARPVDGEGGVADLLSEVRADSATQIVYPRPLDVAGVTAVLGDAADGPVEHAFSQACLDASGGNPFMLSELIRTLREQGIPFTDVEAERVAGISPATVALRVRQTLRHLGVEARALAQAVAVLGEETELHDAAELAGMPLGAATAVAGELARAGVLDQGLPLRFLHPLLAAATRSDLSAAELAAAHSRAAALVRGRGGGPERVALHLMHTAPIGDEEVVAELRAAADLARRRGAPATSAALLTRALAEPPPDTLRPILLLELGRDEYTAGRSALAAEHLEAAHRSAVDPSIRGFALLSLFQAKAGNFSDQRALEPLFERTLPEALAQDRELGLRLWTAKLLTMQPGPAWHEAARGVDELECATPGEAILIGHAALPITRRGTTGPQLASAAERAALHAEPLMEEGATALVMTGIVLGLVWADRLETAERLLGRAIDIARRRGSVADFSVAHNLRATVHHRAGRLRDAEADAQTALAAATGEGWGGAGIGALSTLIASLVDQGRIDDAARELATFLPTGEIPDTPALNLLLWQRMRLRTAQGDAPGARADYAETRRRIDRHFSGIDPSWVPFLLDAAESFHMFGDLAHRDAVLSEAMELAEHWELPGYVGQARHVAARLTAGDDAVDELMRSIELLRGSPSRLELARALITLGEVLRRRGRRTDSREPLREGHELARRCGAETLAETARTELRASGIRLRPEAVSGADSLTASERRIAQLAAAGASNAEIAQALFLTIKTVEGHLTSTYRKLDIPGRSRLADTLTAETPGSGQGSSP